MCETVFKWFLKGCVSKDNIMARFGPIEVVDAAEKAEKDMKHAETEEKAAMQAQIDAKTEVEAAIYTLSPNHLFVAPLVAHTASNHGHLNSCCASACVAHTNTAGPLNPLASTPNVLQFALRGGITVMQSGRGLGGFVCVCVHACKLCIPVHVCVHTCMYTWMHVRTYLPINKGLNLVDAMSVDKSGEENVPKGREAQSDSDRNSKRRRTEPVIFLLV